MTTSNSTRHAHNFVDLSGRKFGALTVLSYRETRGKVPYWNVVCDCGATNVVAGNNLTSGGSTRCGHSCPLRIDPRMKDETGNVYGKLTVLSFAGSNVNALAGAYWNCRCACGADSVVCGRALRNGTIQSCGCTYRKNETGNVYGRLTVVDFAESRRGLAYWRCRCDCGQFTVGAGSDLRKGSTVSCGCKRRGSGGACSGGEKTPEYTTWQEMKRRCYNPNTPYYHLYGGRNITVCGRWKDSFVNFLADMGPKPSPEHTIDRIDNDGNYEPDNCRWATKMEQSHNSRKARLITYNGETLCLREWARRLGIGHMALSTRLNRGWSLKKALTTPPIRSCIPSRHRHVSTP